MIDRAREAFDRKEWKKAHEAFLRADQKAPVSADDLVKMATTAHLLGLDEASDDLWTRAHQEYLGRADRERAIRCAFWLAFGLLQRGEKARGAGWIARANRLLEKCPPECVERGYVLLPEGFRAISEGNAKAAYEAFSRAAEFGERFEDPDLAALSLHSRGRVLIRMGRIEEGIGLLDEAMVAVEADPLSPPVVGDVYCSVIEGCMEIFDLRRAQEWTAALTDWCDGQPDLVPYRGQCLVRRAEIMQLHGAWSEAMTAAREACDWLSRPPGEPAAGAAFYREAELSRLRGHFADAEEGYRQAARWGRTPQPGLARLRLAQGRTEDAAGAIRQAVAGAVRDVRTRSELLAAHVDVMLVMEDLAAAEAAVAELRQLAEALEAPFLQALAAEAGGRLLLAGGDAAAAYDALQDAWSSWEELQAPYEAACARVYMGHACLALQNTDGAEIEFHAARAIFRGLGARPDLERVERLLEPRRPRTVRGLTPRELQVLRLVAAGKSNRTIAGELFISPKTVARHVSNIFRKLGVSSRAAATAFAYEHELV